MTLLTVWLNTYSAIMAPFFCCFRFQQGLAYLLNTAYWNWKNRVLTKKKGG